MVSEGTISLIVATLVRFLGKIIHDALALWSMFQSHHKQIGCIIECTEIFFEITKSLDALAATYSNYKKHNTFKFLVRIFPTGCILFYFVMMDVQQISLFFKILDSITILSMVMR